MATIVFVSNFSQADSLSERLRYGPGQRNHKVGVKPSKAVKIPVDWPLAHDGSITCLTCHERLPDLSERDVPYLRDTDRANQAGFCAKCHTSGPGNFQTSPHWAVMGHAHQSLSQSSGQESSGMMDSASRQCLSCHDGVNASNNASGHANMSSAGLGRGRGEHPVGVRYRKQRSGSRFVSLRHQSQLPKEILLPQGQVSCTSCHDLFASTKARLAIPIKKSALCFACHPMNE